MRINLKLNTVIILISLLLLNACNALKPKYVDSRKRPVDARERAKQNIEQGRGIRLSDIAKRGSTTYEFSTSNPMWRASLEILDFLPLTTVDYSGGIIITDWYNDKGSSDSIKITLRFLSNDIKTNSLKVIVHKKACDANLNCSTTKIKSTIEDELIGSILKKATAFKVEDKEKKKKN